MAAFILPTILKRLAIISSLALILGCTTGCWDYPKFSGKWSGTITRRTLYVEDKECEAVLFKPAKGSEISPLLGSVYLVDANHHVIDASSVTDHAIVKVSGIAGFMYVTDAKGRTATTERRVLGREYEIAEPAKVSYAEEGITKSDKGVWDTAIGAMEIKSITLSSGEKVTLRLAVAQKPPTTQTTDNGNAHAP
jgi:hypothetical protein